MDNIGYIKLHRSLLDSEIFASEKGLKIWIWILLKANYKEKYIPLKIGKGQSTVKIERGQFLFGRFTAEEELNINGSTIYKWIKKMEDMEMIELESNNHYTVVTVCNYNDYNKYNEESNSQGAANEQPTDSKRTANEQQTNTTNKVNKDNKEKNDKNIYIPFAKDLIDKYYSDVKNIIPEKQLNTIRLLIENDKYTKEQIEEAIRKARNDDFWKNNCMSINKLRKKSSDGVVYIDRFLVLKENKPQPQHGKINDYSIDDIN